MMNDIEATSLRLTNDNVHERPSDDLRWARHSGEYDDRGKRFRLYTLIFVVATAAVEIGKSEAWAIIGFGFDLFRTVPSPTQSINEHSLTRAGADRRLPSRNVYANNPNSYINRIRDNGFSSHYGTRISSIARV